MFTDNLEVALVLKVELWNLGKIEMLFRDLSTLCLSASGSSMFALGISFPHCMCQRRLQIIMQLLIILKGLSLIFLIAACTEINFISP